MVMTGGPGILWLETNMRLYKLALPLLLLLTLAAPAQANWLHDAGSWLKDKGAALVQDSRDRMGSGNLFNKALGVVERAAGAVVEAVGKVVDWLSGHRGEAEAKGGGVRADPGAVPGGGRGGAAEADGEGVPPPPKEGEAAAGETVKVQRDIGGDGNGEARGTGGAEGEGDADGQSDEDARWEPGGGGFREGEVGTSRFGRKEMDFNATQTAANGMVIPGFSAGTVCTGAACGKGSGKPATGEPSLGNLLTKADLPTGFGKGRGGRSAVSRAPNDASVDVTKSYEPTLRAQGAAPPPVAVPAEEKKGSWFSGIADAVKGAVAKVGKAGYDAAVAGIDLARRAGQAAVDTGRAVVAAAQDKYNDLVGDAYNLSDKKVELLHKIGLTKAVGDPEGRDDLVHRQTGGTCAVVSQEQVLKSMGVEKSETELFREAVSKGYFGTSDRIPCRTAEGSASNCSIRYDAQNGDYRITDSRGRPAVAATDPEDFMRHHGGTWLDDVGKLIEDNANVTVANRRFSDETNKDSVLETIVKKPLYLAKQRKDLLAQENAGKIALVTVDAGRLWGEKEYLGGLHTVAVTGVEVNRITGKVVGYYINDSGAWPVEKGRLVSRERFEHAWRDDDMQLVYAQ